MTKITHMLVLLLVSLPLVALGQEQQTNMFWGEDASCAAWTKTKTNPAVRAYYLFWIRGFVSGHNLGNPSRQVKAGTFPDAENVFRYLDQYCQENPKSSFIGGAIALDRSLRDPPAPQTPTAKSGAKPPVTK